MARDNSFSYSAKSVSCILGVIRVTGWAKDSFIDIEYNSDSSMLHIGCDGEAARAMSTDDSATIRLRLLQNSPANKVLTILMGLDKFTKNGVVPILIRDPSNNTIHTSLGVWVKKPPRKVYSGRAEAIEWELETNSLLGAISTTA